ncbi:MAG: hypothetical protein GXP27_22360 [Planctomycetes bacterium]|nr:hypothetical protein [Planctomycetota bacterium]
MEAVFTNLNGRAVPDEPGRSGCQAYILGAFANHAFKSVAARKFTDVLGAILDVALSPGGKGTKLRKKVIAQILKNVKAPKDPKQLLDAIKRIAPEFVGNKGLRELLKAMPETHNILGPKSQCVLIAAEKRATLSGGWSSKCVWYVRRKPEPILDSTYSPKFSITGRCDYNCTPGNPYHPCCRRTSASFTLEAIGLQKGTVASVGGST